jgi:hypothetical protein
MVFSGMIRFSTYIARGVWSKPSDADYSFQWRHFTFIGHQCCKMNITPSSAFISDVANRCGVQMKDTMSAAPSEVLSTRIEFGVVIAVVSVIGVAGVTHLQTTSSLQWHTAASSIR